MIRGISGRARKEPTTGEMDTPIVFMDSSFSPDATTGFDHTVKPYANEWAKVDLGLMSYKAGEDTAGEVAHQFIVRNSGYSIDKDNYIVLEEMVYRIVSTMPLNSRNRFILIYAITAGPASKLAYKVKTDGDVEVGDSSTLDTADSLWKSGY